MSDLKEYEIVPHGGHPTTWLVKAIYSNGDRTTVASSKHKLKARSYANSAQRYLNTKLTQQEAVMEAARKYIECYTEIGIAKDVDDKFQVLENTLTALESET